jgi:hypothetical protein
MEDDLDGCAYLSGGLGGAPFLIGIVDRRLSRAVEKAGF